MRYRIALGLAAVVAALLLTSMAASAFDDAKYPDFSGQWVAVRLGVRGQPAFDPTKPWGRGQQAPLTPDYQKVLEESIAQQVEIEKRQVIESRLCAVTWMRRKSPAGDLFGNFEGEAEALGRLREQFLPELRRRELVKGKIAADRGECFSILPQARLLEQPA